MKIVKRTKQYVKEAIEDIADEGTEELDTAADAPVDGDETVPDLPNTINIEWKLSDDMSEVLLTAITINGNPVEGVEDPEAKIKELAGFSTSLDIDEERLGELLAQKNLQEETDGDGLEPALIPPKEEQDDSPITESEGGVAEEENDEELVFESRYMTNNRNLTEAPVWKWATGQL